MRTFPRSVWLTLWAASWLACGPQDDISIPASRGSRAQLAEHRSSAALAEPSGGRPAFVRVSEADDLRLDPVHRASEPITVVVKLAAEPVAEQAARLPTGRMVRPSHGEKRRRMRELEQAQVPLREAIAGLGGEVLGAYQLAYNGLKVRIAVGLLPQLRGLAGVVAVHPVRRIRPDNVNGVPMIDAPRTWAGMAGLRGEGVRIGIIDTGIDYTHADFGGPGTSAAFAAAKAKSTLAPDPSLVGPAAPKIKGGVDLVGDAYNASGSGGAQVPHPDPNPFDCYGHGTHVAATAAGVGVLDSGAPYSGPYDETTYSARSFRVGPGVAPKAELYAIRVFGCAGETTSDIIVDAIEWSLAQDLDVINLSLGSPFGTAEGIEQEAVNHAAAAGLLTVASAGNSGPEPYLTGAPAAAQRAISVAAIDPRTRFRAAQLALSSGKSVTAINANGETLPTRALPVLVLRSPDGSVSLGCDPTEYAGSRGALVVVRRGTCARVARAIYGQKAGAAAVVMINNAPDLPPYEGAIRVNPDTGEEYAVTIPFLGLRGAPSSDGPDVVAAGGGSAMCSDVTLPNPGYRAFAGFTSAGPRLGDSYLKPDVSAPGVSILSAGMGLASGGEIMSGTSMAAPHVAGMAALLRQAHPSWNTEDLKLAIVNTTDPQQVAGYQTRRGGAGLVQATAAVRTQVLAVGERYSGTLNFGFAELPHDFAASKPLVLENRGASDVTFDIAPRLPQGAPHLVRLGKTRITVPAHASATLDVRLEVSAATVGNSDAFRDVSGLLRLTPDGDGNSGISLHVPYYLVPRALSAVRTQLSSPLSTAEPSATAHVVNESAVSSGSADFYAWGLADESEGQGSHDLRAVGVQSFAAPSSADPERRLLVFAINTWRRWSSAAVNAFQINVDVDEDGQDDYVVLGVDQGSLTGGSYNGVMVSAVFAAASGRGGVRFLAVAPTDSSTLLLPIYSSDLCMPGAPCLSASAPRFRYQAESATFDGVDTMRGSARFNAWSSAVSQGQFVTLPPGGSGAAEVELDPREWTLSPALGLLVVSLDNRSGAAEAQLLRFHAR